MIDDPSGETWEEFEESMGVSADCDGEGFFHYDFDKCWKYTGIDIHKIQPILDEGHDRLEATFERVRQRTLSKAKKIEEVRSSHPRRLI